MLDCANMWFAFQPGALGATESDGFLLRRFSNDYGGVLQPWKVRESHIRMAKMSDENSAATTAVGSLASSRELVLSG
jgi:hypothetical protein